MARSLKQFQGPLADPEKRTRFTSKLCINYVFRVVGETGRVFELQRSLSKPVDFTSTPKNVLPPERGEARIMEEDEKKKKRNKKKRKRKICNNGL